MLELSNVSFSFPSGKNIVENFDLSLSSGEIIGIFGPSGAGKSTTFRVIAGLLTPTSGTIKFNGDNLQSVPVAERPITFLQQSFPLYPHLTVIENVCIPLRQNFDHDKEQTLSKARRMLNKLNISNQYHSRYPPTLSGGESQRIALAKALVKPAHIILLDEPYSNIDKALRLKVSQVVRDEVASHDKGVIIISHDEDDLIFSADRAAMMKSGHLLQVGAPENLIADPVSANAAAFGAPLGLQRIDTKRLTGGRVSFGPSLQIPERASRLGWRPSASHIQRLQQDASAVRASESLRIRGEIERRIHLGDKIYITVLAPGLTPSEHLWHGSSAQDLPTELKAGDSVCLYVSIDQLYLLDSNDEVVSS